MPCWSECARSRRTHRPHTHTPRCPSRRTTRPVFKEFTTWPDIPKDPDYPVTSKKDKAIQPELAGQDTCKNTPNEKMTRKSRPRIKDREDTKEAKGGYCEMCNTDYTDAAIHRRSPHHLAFVRDHSNFLALDSLIGAGADVQAFLDKATPVNGERRSLRKLCNGEAEVRSKRSHTPDAANNGVHSPRRQNGGIEEKRNTRRRRSPDTASDNRQYYKVVGVSTKLRSSGGFAAPKRETPTLSCNGGTAPLVVKFRRVRRSELSVLSDEAEQFMFPRRASSSSDEEEEEESNSPPPPPQNMERRRSARPTALKEESSEDDSSQEDRRRRKRRGPPAAKKLRPITPPQELSLPEPEPTVQVVTPVELVEVKTPQEPQQICLKWEEGRLKATPAVEKLEFAFESVPNSEPWFEVFQRQDQDKQIPKNIPQYFAMYTTSPMLPYEMGQLPPLKPNCCPLSDIVKKDDKMSISGPSRSYGTRGNKKQRIRKRTAAALIAMEKHPRKSPREHASTLAILGGLLHRRKNTEDTKSIASEDISSDAHSITKSEPPAVSAHQLTSERLKQFFSEVFDDAADYEIPEEAMEGEATVSTRHAVPDVVGLVSECDACDIIREEVREGALARGSSTVRRGRFKKKNRTGWPNKKKVGVKRESSSGAGSEVKTDAGFEGEGSSVDAPETVEETPQDESASETEEPTPAAPEEENEPETRPEPQPEKKTPPRSNGTEGSCGESSADEASEVSAASAWDAALQPVVRVSRVEVTAARQLRSSGRRSRSARFR